MLTRLSREKEMKKKKGREKENRKKEMKKHKLKKYLQSIPNLLVAGDEDRSRFRNGES
jgi:hypothetical protein